MGEAQRRRRHRDVLLDGVPCVYCGGSSPATTVDHMPPRVLFRQDQRPKGLEFPSCRGCNAGTSAADVVAALFARTFPGIETEADRSEWGHLTSDAQRVAPGLIEEMYVHEPYRSLMNWKLGLPKDQTLFFAAGPIAWAHMTAFGAKAGFALYHHYTGTPIPLGGGVQVRWFTNSEVMAGQLPEDFLRNLGDFEILRQGRITSKFTFEYVMGQQQKFPYVTTFSVKSRQAFVYAIFAAADLRNLPFSDEELPVFKPGEFQNPIVAKIATPRDKTKWIADVLSGREDPISPIGPFP